MRCCIKVRRDQKVENLKIENQKYLETTNNESTSKSFFITRLFQRISQRVESAAWTDGKRRLWSAYIETFTLPLICFISSIFWHIHNRHSPVFQKSLFMIWSRRKPSMNVLKPRKLITRKLLYHKQMKKFEGQEYVNDVDEE